MAGFVDLRDLARAWMPGKPKSQYELMEIENWITEEVDSLDRGWYQDQRRKDSREVCEYMLSRSNLPLVQEATFHFQLAKITLAKLNRHRHRRAMGHLVSAERSAQEAKNALQRLGARFGTDDETKLPLLLEAVKILQEDCELADKLETERREREASALSEQTTSQSNPLPQTLSGNGKEMEWREASEKDVTDKSSSNSPDHGLRAIPAWNKVADAEVASAGDNGRVDAAGLPALPKGSRREPMSLEMMFEEGGEAPLKNPYLSRHHRINRRSGGI